MTSALHMPLVHGSLRFEYRPALVEERSQLSDAAAELKSHLYDRHVAAFVAGKIVSWDLADAVGQDVPIAAAALLRLQPELFVKLHRVVLGWAASDVDPRWPAETADRHDELATSAVLSGRTVGEVRQEADLKN